MAVKKNSKKIVKTELVRVDRATFEKVKEMIKTTRQSIGGFYTLAAEKQLQSQNL